MLQTQFTLSHFLQEQAHGMNASLEADTPGSVQIPQFTSGVILDM